ncbi:hypothetical protein ACFPK9_14630 [Rubritalea spongiae]|uniref:Transcriptional regulator n=1 Tax=Rubritalea spongiae TaxID=430797 RepID=A0ABW5DXM6_9BACT
MSNRNVLEVETPMSARVYYAGESLFNSRLKLTQELWKALIKLRGGSFSVAEFTEISALLPNESSHFLNSLCSMGLIEDRTQLVEFSSSDLAKVASETPLPERSQSKGIEPSVSENVVVEVEVDELIEIN